MNGELATGKNGKLAPQSLGCMRETATRLARLVRISRAPTRREGGQREAVEASPDQKLPNSQLPRYLHSHGTRTEITNVAVLRGENLPRFVTSDIPNADGLYSEDALLIKGFRDQGVHASPVVWSVAGAGWDVYDMALVRST